MNDFRPELIPFGLADPLAVVLPFARLLWEKQHRVFCPALPPPTSPGIPLSSLLSSLVLIDARVCKVGDEGGWGEVYAPVRAHVDQSLPKLKDLKRLLLLENSFHLNRNCLIGHLLSTK